MWPGPQHGHASVAMAPNLPIDAGWSTRDMRSGSDLATDSDAPSYYRDLVRGTFSKWNGTAFGSASAKSVTLHMIALIFTPAGSRSK